MYVLTFDYGQHTSIDIQPKGQLETVETEIEVENGNGNSQN